MPRNARQNRADRILEGLQVFSPDDPWNQDISGWPLHPRSRDIIAAMNRSGYRIQRVYVTGGGTKNPLWLQEHASRRVR